MTTPTVSPLPDVRAKLRSLGGYERVFLAVDLINGFNFGIAVSFRGTVGHARWKAASAAVQKRHPLLDASINSDDPQAPFFARGAGLPIPLAFLRRNSVTDWQRTMESDVAEPFDLSAGPLMRAVLLEDAEGCDLVLTAHHAVIDGIGVVTLAGELLCALAGRPLDELPVPPSAEERAAERRAFAQANPSQPPSDAPAPPEAAPADRAYASRNRKGRAAIAATRFSPEETTRLHRRARAEQTTIGAVLLAGAASALRGLSPELSTADLRLTTPIDARPYLGNANDFVLSIISPRAIAPAADRELFASARDMKAQIAPAQSLEGIEATYGHVGAALSQGLDTATLVNVLVQGFGHDVLLSNLKSVEFPCVPEGLAVEAVWGPSVLLGAEGEQTIGAATFDGALHLVHSSFTPVAGLLDTMREKLTAACAAD